MSKLNDMPAQPGSAHQRKVKYIDHVLQKWLLVALVFLELVVLSVAGAILHFRLDAIVEENLYRVHFEARDSMLSVLMVESAWIVGGMIAVNLLALFVADRIWVRYVNGICADLRRLLTNTRALDLRKDPDVLERHEVLSLAVAWRQAERARHLALHQSIEHLATQNSADPQEYREALLAVRRHLPEKDL